jgi:hypothetical protein
MRQRHNLRTQAGHEFDAKHTTAQSGYLAEAMMKGVRTAAG